MLNTLAAILFSLIAAGVVAFQIALLFGVPWGEFTLGGKCRGRLPWRVRLVPALSALLLAGFTLVIAASAGLVFPELTPSAPILAWVVVAYCASGTIANFVTSSRRERALWLPVVSLMLVTSVVVATN